LSIRPAARTPSSQPDLTDPRTESGERRINLPVDLQATRVSERFLLPEEALPTVPPPAPSRTLGGADGAPALATATSRIPIPESIKLLSAAIPTPQGFDASPIDIPASAPAPRIDPDGAGAGGAPNAPAEAKAASERPPAAARPARRRQIGSAVALFVILLGVSAIALRLCADFLFR